MGSMHTAKGVALDLRGQNLHKLMCVDIIKSCFQPLWMVMKKLDNFLLWLPVGKRVNEGVVGIYYGHAIGN